MRACCMLLLGPGFVAVCASVESSRPPCRSYPERVASVLTNRDPESNRDWLQTQLGLPRRISPARLILRSINWEIFVGFLVVLGFLTYVLYQSQAKAVVPATVAFVLVGWVFSLCLHEFGHAAAAVLGGDNSDSTITYLSFNPLRYVNPFLSIILPIVFIFLGGIGLPGGAVYINRGRIRSRGAQSMVSLAGPLMNAVFTLVLMIPFLVAPDFAVAHLALASAMAVLAFFQVFAIVLNLLPIPPLDGFGAIAPWLSAEAQVSAYAFGTVGLVVIFFLLWVVPQVNYLLINIISTVLAWGHISYFFWALGYQTLFFWR